jgi:hypothetical protein
MDIFDLACKKMDSIPCAATTIRATAVAAGFTGALPLLVVYRSFQHEDEFKASLALNTSAAMLEFMQLASFPLLIELSQSTDALMFSEKRIGYHTHVIVALDGTHADSISLIQSLRTLAASYEGRCAFTYLDVSKETDYISTLIADLQIAAEDAPVAIIVKSAKTEVRQRMLKILFMLSQF